MNVELLIALITGFCTITGSAFGVLATQKLTTYRIQKLEQLVESHSRTIERISVLDIRLTEVLSEVREMKGGVRRCN